jgi:hypothetical protein
MKQDKSEKKLHPFRFDSATIELLDKLQEKYLRTSRNNTLEYLIKKAAKEEGLIK